MRVSRNESLALVRRALEGIGCSQGEREDAAAAVIWAQMCGLDGMALLQQALRYLQHETPGALATRAETQGHIELDARGAPCMLCGPLVTDLLYVRALDSGRASATLHNCSGRTLIGWSLLTTSRRGMCCLAHWRSAPAPAPHHLLSVGAGEEQLCCESYSRDEPRAAAADDCSLHLVCARGASAVEEYRHSLLQRQTPGSLQTPQQQRQCYENSLEHGIEADAGLLRELGILGARVLVEDTPESRDRGAGPSV